MVLDCRSLPLCRLCSSDISTQPTPTGLEELPKFGTSLGCSDSSAPYIYEGATQIYSNPVAVEDSSHYTLALSGAAMGTLTVTEAEDDNITLELTLRTDVSTRLNGALLDVRSPGTMGLWTKATLVTPTDLRGACMRFDATLRVPLALRRLTLIADAVTQIQFDPHAMIGLNALTVELSSIDTRSLLQLSATVQAQNTLLRATRGWIIGDVAIVNSTSITTSGDAVTNVHVHPSPLSNDRALETAYLTTVHGTGRTDYFYESDPAYAHRRIVSSHSSRRGGDLYLTYKNADYSGPVEYTAKSSSAYGLQGMAGARRPGQVDGPLPWVGSPDGEDMLIAQNPKGWIGIYF